MDTFIVSSMDSASESDRDEWKREIEDSDWESKITPGNPQSQPSPTTFKIRNLCLLLFSYFVSVVVNG